MKLGTDSCVSRPACVEYSNRFTVSTSGHRFSVAKAFRPWDFWRAGWRPERHVEGIELATIVVSKGSTFSTS